MKISFVVLTSILFVAWASDVAARNTEHNLSAKEAAASDLGQEKLLDVPFYMAGQKHPGVAKEVGEWTSNRITRAAFRSDEASCQVAFLSAIIALQERALEEGGNAVVDIVSITGDKETKSASQYRCYAGATVARVALRGTVVKLK
jgi:hypothetical protein